jgi:hypothetical protein
MMGWKEEKVTREVKGDKMHVVSHTTVGQNKISGYNIA